MYASVRVRGTEKKGNEYVRLSDYTHRNEDTQIVVQGKEKKKLKKKRNKKFKKLEKKKKKKEYLVRYLNTVLPGFLKASSVI